MTAWDYLMNASVIRAGETLLIDKTAGFFYLILLFASLLIVYIATKSTGAVFMTAFVSSFILITYNKIPYNFHYIIYMLMVFSLTFYLYKMFWNSK